MSEWQTLDFKPRARGMVVGDVRWLARITEFDRDIVIPFVASEHM